MMIFFDILLKLLQHLTIFFTLIYLIKYIVLSKYKVSSKLEYPINGVLFAIIACIGMVMRIELGAGTYIDGRIILVGISAAYIHPIAGIVTAILVSFFRLSIGGIGVPIGIIGICGGALVGILFYVRNKSIPKNYSPQMLILLGLLLTIQAQIWIPILFPWDVAVKLLQKVSLVGLISYPIGTLIIGLILNTLSRHKQAEEQVKASLKEKQTLIDEIHHRVKNNMNVISSFLKLQSNNIEDDKTKDILKDSQNRIFAMSAIHETLHRSNNLSEIDLKIYLSKIVTSVFQANSIASVKVILNNNLEELTIDINQASPLGLIVNELISNSLKHAFPGDQTGEINVSTKKMGKDLQLTVKDDGIGLPVNFNWQKNTNLGLQLVKGLVENQLDGCVEIVGTEGTQFVIKFKLT